MEPAPAHLFTTFELAISKTWNPTSRPSSELISLAAPFCHTLTNIFSYTFCSMKPAPRHVPTDIEAPLTNQLRTLFGPALFSKTAGLPQVKDFEIVLQTQSLAPLHTQLYIDEKEPFSHLSPPPNTYPHTFLKSHKKLKSNTSNQ